MKAGSHKLPRTAALLILAPLAFVWAGCAGPGTATAELPPRLQQWMERNSDPRFPQNRYLVGVGVGDSPNAAGDDGRAAILGTFRTEIQNTITRVESELVRTEDGRTSFEGDSITLDNLEAEVAGTLEGARIADGAQHPETGAYWALVVVERSTLATNLLRRIDDGDRTLAQLAREARSMLESHRIFQMRALLATIPDHLARQETLRTELSLVAGSRAVKPASIPLDEWIALEAACAAELAFAVQSVATWTDSRGMRRGASEAAERAILEAVKGGLRDADGMLGAVDAPALSGSQGLTPEAFDMLSRSVQRERAGGAGFLIRARVDSSFSSQFGSKFVYRSQYAAEIIDLFTGEVLTATISGEAKGSRPHANEEVAATLSLREASAALARDVAANLRK